MNWRATGAQDYPGGQLDEAIVGSQIGSHRGKGPKDYRPSDERLRENVCERLTDDPFIDATDIAVSAANGEVTLSGSVETRGMKYAVEDVIAEMAGVTAVHNSIRVRRTI
jgi:osmotically-inducible protein OsmY